MSDDTKRATSTALRTITLARIACTNTIHELEVIDGMTDDWNRDNARLATDALEIHLQAQFCAKEASTILEMLTGVMTAAGMAVLEDWLCMELEVRRENAVMATTEMITILDTLEDALNKKAISTDELALAEMKRRAQLVGEKLHNLEKTLVKLTVDWKAAIEARFNPRENDGDVFSPRAASGM